jgi:lipopolysaccharide export system protein LptA
MRRLALAVAALLTLADTGSAIAQGNPLGALGTSDEPLEIESDQGFELYQERNLVVAKGNVLVQQGPTRLQADLVSASYDEVDGRRTIHRLDAVGNVRIQSNKERLYGEHATYDLRRELFLLTGDNLRIEGENQTVTAKDSLEYWGPDKRAVARGDATAIQNSDNTRLRADVLEALLAEKGGAKNMPAPAAQGGDLTLDKVRAWGNVTITTESEVVHGNRGVYDASKKLATLEGDVQITRGKNQLNGEKAIINLETGVSRLVAAPGQRVQSIFYPGSVNEAPSPLTPRANTEEARPKSRPAGAP